MNTTQNATTQNTEALTPETILQAAKNVQEYAKRQLRYATNAVVLRSSDDQSELATLEEAANEYARAANLVKEIEISIEAHKDRSARLCQIEAAFIAEPTRSNREAFICAAADANGALCTIKAHAARI